MKKLILFFVLFLSTNTLVFPQFEKIWEKNVGSFSWFGNDHMTRAMAYNPVTNHLLVASRTGGHRIYILDVATGDSLGAMDMTGVSGGTFALNWVRCTSDGIIYAGNLQVTAGSDYKIYRWANESAVPTVAFTGPVTARTGDAMEVVGTGANTVIYVSGTPNTNIEVFTTTDGLNFTQRTPIAVSPPGRTR